MSMFGFGRPQISSAEKIAAAEQEMDLVTDMFNKYVSTSQTGNHSSPSTKLTPNDRLTKACLKKCIPTDYREGELNKGEGVCLDRCSAKFFDVQMKISEILQAEAAAKGASGGGGLGFGGI